jgi:hypothetical protein
LTIIKREEEKMMDKLNNSKIYSMSKEEEVC